MIFVNFKIFCINLRNIHNFLIKSLLFKMNHWEIVDHLNAKKENLQFVFRLSFS